MGSSRSSGSSKRGKRPDPENGATLPAHAHEFAIRGHNKEVVAGGPRACRGRRCPAPTCAGRSAHRWANRAPAMADGEDHAPVAHRVPVDVVEGGDGADADALGRRGYRPRRCGRSPTRCAVSSPDEKGATTMPPSTAGLAPPRKPALSSMGRVAPQQRAVAGVERPEPVVMAHAEHAAAGNRGAPRAWGTPMECRHCKAPVSASSASTRPRPVAPNSQPPDNARPPP